MRLRKSDTTLNSLNCPSPLIARISGSSRAYSRRSSFASSCPYAVSFVIAVPLPREKSTKCQGCPYWPLLYFKTSRAITGLPPSLATDNSYVARRPPDSRNFSVIEIGPVQPLVTSSLNPPRLETAFPTLWVSASFRKEKTSNSVDFPLPLAPTSAVRRGRSRICADLKARKFSISMLSIRIESISRLRSAQIGRADSTESALFLHCS